MTKTAAAQPLTTPGVVAGCAAIPKVPLFNAMVAAGPRKLRTRPPHWPLIGTCDVVVSEVKALEALVKPYCILGLEGHEFLAEQIVGTASSARRGELRYSFSMSSVQSNFQAYLYDDVSGAHHVLGRVLVPLTDVLWPVGEAPSMARLRAGFERGEKTVYEREYTLRFLPPSAEFGDGSSSGSSGGQQAFWDSYGWSSPPPPPSSRRPP